MKRLKGPEIKMPKLQAPQLLVDLYYDLDERHLLPVVAILVVAIIAIPLLLSGSSDPEESGSSDAQAGASASAAPSAKRSALVVAKAAPGLRDYKRRLGHLRPKDPFKAKYTADKGGGEASASSSSEATESVPATPVESGGEGAGGEGSGGGTSPGSVPGSGESEVTYFTYAIDVRVVPVSAGDGKPSKAEPSVRRELPPLTMLPSHDTPALTYIGPSRDGKKAMMMVSADVTSLFGDSKCVVGSQTCQLLALEPGLPETVVFGPQARTYRVELLKIQIVTSDHLRRAPLGDPKPGKAG